MNNKHQILQMIAHLLFAVISAWMFLDAIDGPIHGSYLHWLMFGMVWPNVWLACQRWNDAYTNV
jgi:hypothetical protein